MIDNALSVAGSAAHLWGTIRGQGVMVAISLVRGNTQRNQMVGQIDLIPAHRPQ